MIFESTFTINSQPHKDVTSSCSDPNYCKRNNPLCLARRICNITENNSEKLKNLENFKLNLSKYYYPDSLVKNNPKKISQMETSCHSLQNFIQTTLIFKSPSYLRLIV